MSRHFTIPVSLVKRENHQFGAVSSHRFGETVGMANYIKARRIELDVTQERLAEMAGTSPQQVARLENSPVAEVETAKPSASRRLTLGWIARLAPGLQTTAGRLAFDLLRGAGLTPETAEFVDDPDELALLGLWRDLTDDQRALLLRIAQPPSQAA